MTDPNSPPDDPPVFAALDAERRRLAVVALHDRSGPVPVEDLAEAVAGREADRDPVPEDRHRRVELSLRHADLPKLAWMGLVRREREGVALTSTQATSQAVELALATAGRDRSTFDGLFEALAHRQRRTAVDVLRSAGEPLRLDDLADRVATASPAASTDRLVASLDHLHLPKLDDARIVTYDRDDRRVAFEELPEPFGRVLAERGPDVYRQNGGRPNSGDSLSPVR